MGKPAGAGKLHPQRQVPLRQGEKTPIKNKGENNMSKKLLSLALALVMCLGLTVPAFVAGTVKVVEDKTHSVKITMNGFL